MTSVIITCCIVLSFIDVTADCCYCLILTVIQRKYLLAKHDARLCDMDAWLHPGEHASSGISHIIIIIIVVIIVIIINIVIISSSIRASP